jgi:peptidoglycan hydrolase-like protein with peptidoglycan-binding domain
VVEQRCEILDDVDGLIGVVQVQVPGIYGKRGVDPLPERMAKLVRAAAEALDEVYEEVARKGGHLYISDMFRSAEDQQRAHEDYLAGRKESFSPPACSGVHESGRAIDIDAFDTGIGHARTRRILNDHGWVNIVESLTASECWHYEFREARWEEFKDQNGYSAMAHAMKEEIGNVQGSDLAEANREEIKWLQRGLNEIMNAGLGVDGVYGPRTKVAVKRFQERYGLQVDGVAGPITKEKLQELLKEG